MPKKPAEEEKTQKKAQKRTQEDKTIGSGSAEGNTAEGAALEEEIIKDEQELEDLEGISIDEDLENLTPEELEEDLGSLENEISAVKERKKAEETQLEQMMKNDLSANVATNNSSPEIGKKSSKVGKKQESPKTEKAPAQGNKKGTKNNKNSNDAPPVDSFYSIQPDLQAELMKLVHEYNSLLITGKKTDQFYDKLNNVMPQKGKPLTFDENGKASLSGPDGKSIGTFNLNDKSLDISDKNFSGTICLSQGKEHYVLNYDKGKLQTDKSILPQNNKLLSSLEDAKGNKHDVNQLIDNHKQNASKEAGKSETLGKDPKSEGQQQETGKQSSLAHTTPKPLPKTPDKKQQNTSQEAGKGKSVTISASQEHQVDPRLAANQQEVKVDETVSTTIKGKGQQIQQAAAAAKQQVDSKLNADVKNAEAQQGKPPQEHNTNDKQKNGKQQEGKTPLQNFIAQANKSATRTNPNAPVTPGQTPGQNQQHQRGAGIGGGK